MIGWWLLVVTTDPLLIGMDSPSQDGFCDAPGLHGAFGFGHQKHAHAADAEAQTRGDQQGEPSLGRKKRKDMEGWYRM